MTGLPLIRTKRPSADLEVGDRYRLHADCKDPRVWEVMRVGPGSMSVRPVSGKTHVEFQTASGDDVDFERAGRRVQVCRRPLGIIKED